MLPVCWYVSLTASLFALNDSSPGPAAAEVRLGPGAQITLNAPANGAYTMDNFMPLNATVTDASPTTVWFYGGTTSPPGDLLYVRENVTGTQTFDYDWNAKRFDPESGRTMGLWHFDEGSGTGIGDESGNGNAGTASSSPVWSVDGRFGYALDFDGTDDYIAIPDAASLDIDSASGEITIESWIYPHASGTGKWRSIVAKRAIGGGPANYELSLDQVTGNLLFYGGHYPQIWISSIAVPLNEWSYVAVTLKATEGRLRFYRNGALLDSTVAYGGNGGCFGAANSTVLTIGTAGGTSECFDGLIDEVRLTNRALSSAEIAANYSDGLTTGTYYWQVVADDGAKTLVESEVRHFHVGPDGEPPEIVLISPDVGAMTPEEHMTLLATVADQSSTTVRIYGDTASDPTALLHVHTGVIGSQTIEYAWDASRLNVQPPYTMGLWHADDASGTSLADASGNGHSGTFVGAPVWSTGGKFGYALELDGTDDYVTIPDGPSLDIDSASGEITIEAWIYPHTSGSNIWRSIISKKAIGGAAPVNYQISLDRVTGNLLFYSGHWPQIWISSVSIPLNQWSYVAVTLKAAEGRLRFYRNGLLLDSTVTYNGNGGCFGAANNTVLTIGTAGLIAECYDGGIDDIRLTRRALSSAEIAANYKLGNGTYQWKVTAVDSLGLETTAGPRPFTIRTNSAPQFVNCPVDQVPVSHCQTATYDLDAVDPEGDSLRYTVVEHSGTGIAAIDSLTGIVSYLPGLPLDINRTVTVTVDVHEADGPYSAACAVPFVVTNQAPVVYCGQTPVQTLANRTVVKDDILGGDYDICDSLAVLLMGGPGVLSMEGIYTWTPGTADTGWHHVTITASDGIEYVECGFDIEVVGQPFELELSRNENILPGHFVTLEVVQTAGHQALGGYDLLIAFDAGTLTFIEAEPGDYFDRCQWEYFAYRIEPWSECGSPCPTGMINLLAFAEINNGSTHPSCSLTTLPASLGRLTFKTTTNQSLACTFLPVYFFWREFKDNRLWSPGNDSLYMSSRVFDFTGTAGFDDWTEVTDLSFGLPGRYGLPTTASLDSLPADSTGYFRYIDFKNGGIRMSCCDSLCLRGDINVNGIRNEVADAVMYVNYFLSGLSAFGSHAEASIAASDVNHDGSMLSIGDLVALIRIINGDALPYGKPAESVGFTLRPVRTDTMLVVEYDASVEVGAALLTFQLAGTCGVPRLGHGASGMTLAYELNGDELRVLIYDLGRNGIRPGTDTLCLIPVDGEAILTAAEAAAYDGGSMTATIVEPVYAVLLEQNRPNPFNPATVISYGVPAETHVTLDIFNLLGQHLVTLVDEDKPAGMYRVSWNGRDAAGMAVATGVYLYRLHAGGHTETKQMVLIK